MAAPHLRRCRQGAIVVAGVVQGSRLHQGRRFGGRGRDAGQHREKQDQKHTPHAWHRTTMRNPRGTGSGGPGAHLSC